MILGNLFSIAVFIALVISGGWIINNIFRVPKCSKCGTELLCGGEYMFCPNSECKMYLVRSYE